MKRTFILILAALFLCACVPTPEVDAVKQKDTNVLIDTVRNEQKEQQDTGKTPPTVKEQFPDRFTADFVTSAQNVHVTADATIEVLSETGSFPMLRVQHRYLSDDERLTVAKRLMRSDRLYLYEYRQTREMLAGMIRMLMQEMTPEEKAEWMKEEGATEAEWEQMQSRRQRLVESYQKQYNELPEDEAIEPYIEWFGAAPDYSEDYENHRNFDWLVRSATDTTDLSFLDHLIVSADECDRPIEFTVALRSMDDDTSIWCFDDSHKYRTERIDPKDYETPHEGASVTPNDAIEVVKSIFEGVSDLVASDVWWANNAMLHGDSGVLMCTRRAYLIHFSVNYRGAYTPYCRTAAFEVSDAGYARVWDYESLTAAVDGDGNLISLVWLAPHKETDVIAENTTLLPYEEIYRIFETQMNRVFAAEDKRDGSLDVTAVQLGLFRIREKNNMESGFLVPAWYFTGVFHYSAAATAQRSGFQEPDSEWYDARNPLLIVNAIDGSIIDPQNGY